MKKAFILILLLPLLWSCVSDPTTELTNTTETNIPDLGNWNDNFEFNNYYTHGYYEPFCSLQKLNVLNEFGITKTEWNNMYFENPLWKCITTGAYHINVSKVESNFFEVIKTSAIKQHKKYYAILDLNIDSIRTGSTSRIDYNTSFSAYVMFFDQDEIIYKLRDGFKKIKIYETFAD